MATTPRRVDELQPGDIFEFLGLQNTVTKAPIIQGNGYASIHVVLGDGTPETLTIFRDVEIYIRA